MTKYLISFPSGAMVFPDEDLQAASDASHAVVEEAKAAGVWVFGGGIDESVPPVAHTGRRHVRSRSSAALAERVCRGARRGGGKAPPPPWTPAGERDDIGELIIA